MWQLLAGARSQPWDPGEVTTQQSSENGGEMA